MSVENYVTRKFKFISMFLKLLPSQVKWEYTDISKLTWGSNNNNNNNNKKRLVFINLRSILQLEMVATLHVQLEDLHIT